jgi:prolyl-tRNA editing enzyme YbaK/EbsC (Cys-tRNA(Pro) deacylase)
MIADPDNPRSWLRVFRLAEPVVSCSEAAVAKGVPLERELKSLLLECDHGRVLVHLRGDHRLSLHAVKRALAVRQARLASPSAVQALGVSPGTLHPFHPALWTTTTYLIARGLFSLPWVTTNAGHPNEYIVFDPLVLLRAPRILVGEFER